ncbi:hypothetical protein AHiyo6_01300, partial [Arthrobacter sp. Hiyo6]
RTRAISSASPGRRVFVARLGALLGLGVQAASWSTIWIGCLAGSM